MVDNLIKAPATRKHLHIYDVKKEAKLFIVLLALMLLTPFSMVTKTLSLLNREQYRAENCKKKRSSFSFKLSDLPT